MTIQTALLCDSAATYEDKLCVLGSFDTIWARHFPASHHHCAIAVRLLTQDEDVGEHTVRAKFLDPDGFGILPDGGPCVNVMFFPVPDNSYFRSYNLVFNINGLPLPEPGHYFIDLTLDDVSIARIPLQVLQVEEQEAERPGDMRLN